MTGQTQDRVRLGQVILAAMNAQISILTTLQEVFDVDEGRAKSLLRWARENQLLGIGRHRPTRAVIKRGTPHERFWLVCEHCITPWPCPRARQYGAIAPEAAERPETP